IRRSSSDESDREDCADHHHPAAPRLGRIVVRLIAVVLAISILRIGSRMPLLTRIIPFLGRAVENVVVSCGVGLLLAVRCLVPRRQIAATAGSSSMIVRKAMLGMRRSGAFRRRSLPLRHALHPGRHSRIYGVVPMPLIRTVI